MTKEDALAREAGIDVYGLGHDRAKFIEAIKHFEALARADEREACAKVCDDMGPCGFTGESCAAAIRARGETK
jgi:hypothetical protein